MMGRQFDVFVISKSDLEFIGFFIWLTLSLNQPKSLKHLLQAFSLI